MASRSRKSSIDETIRQRLLARKKKDRERAKKAKQKAKERAERQKLLEKEYRKIDRDLERERKQRRRAIDKGVAARMSALKRAGLYNPKDKKLTKYRRARVRNLYAIWRDFLRPDKFFFIPVKGKKKQRRKIIEKAKNLDMVVTKKGIFHEREFTERAAIKYNRKLKEYQIVTKSKIKSGQNEGKIITKVTPLADIGEVDNLKDRLREHAKSLGPLIKRDDPRESDVLAFEIRDNHTSYSLSTFSNEEALLKYLDQYQRTPGGKIELFRSITIKKTSRRVWLAEHPPQSRSRRRQSARMRKLGRA